MADFQCRRSQKFTFSTYPSDQAKIKHFFHHFGIRIIQRPQIFHVVCRFEFSPRTTCKMASAAPTSHVRERAVLTYTYNRAGKNKRKSAPMRA